MIGSDTGPLHLGVACGARAIGWYFSRARVHETGPYGVGHYVWQHQKSVILKNREAQGLGQELGTSLFMACHANNSTDARMHRSANPCIGMEICGPVIAMNGACFIRMGGNLMTWCCSEKRHGNACLPCGLIKMPS